MKMGKGKTCGPIALQETLMNCEHGAATETSKTDVRYADSERPK